jgi:hypothetical protein
MFLANPTYFPSWIGLKTHKQELPHTHELIQTYSHTRKHVHTYTMGVKPFDALTLDNL